ncbi:MAG: hypothetical protein AB9866_24085 [Syntrophobacteraceae bacterium]
MEDQNHIIDQMHLENGLTVLCVDQSRPIAGDRFQVQLLIRVPVEAEAAYFKDYPDPDEAFREFTLLVNSEPVAFQVVKVRNFIDADLVDKMLQEMKDDFFQSGLEYLKRPQFAANFIIRKYEELRRAQTCRNAYQEALSKVE